MLPETAMKILTKTKSRMHYWHGPHVQFVQDSKMGRSPTFHWMARSGMETQHPMHSNLSSRDRLLAGLAPEWVESSLMLHPEGVVSHLRHEQGLWEAVLECAPYAASDKTRIALNGVCISGVIGGRGAVAVDGHRMRFVPGDWGQDATEGGSDTIIIPSEVIEIAKPLAKSLYDFEVITATHETFTDRPGWHDGATRPAGYKLVSKVVFCRATWRDKAGDLFSCWWNATEFGPFPNFSTIVPRQFQTEQEVDCEALRKSLKACEKLVSKSTQQVELHPSMGEVIVSYRNYDLGIPDLTIAGRAKSARLSGNEHIPDIGFNLKYLAEAIGKEKSCVFKFNSPTQAVVIERSLGYNIVMPLWIQA